MRKRLGELLVERGLIDRAQLHEALGVQRRNGMRLGDVLIACGHIEEVALTRALGDLLEIASVDLDGLQPDPHAIEMVSARFAAEHDVFPVALRRERGRRVLTVAMSNPMDMSAVDELGFMTNAHIETRLASVTDIDPQSRTASDLLTVAGRFRSAKAARREIKRSPGYLDLGFRLKTVC